MPNFEAAETAGFFEPSVIDWHLRWDLSGRTHDPFRDDILLEEDMKNVDEERVIRFIHGALTEVIHERIEEIKKPENRGALHLLQLTSMPVPKTYIPVYADLLGNTELIERGIFVADASLFRGPINTSHELDIFESGEINDTDLPWIAEALRQRLILLEKKKGGHFGESDDPELDIKLEDLFILDERLALLDEDDSFIMDPTYDIDVVRINFSDIQKAKFNEVLRIGKTRSTLNGLLRTFGGGPALE